MSHTWLVVSYVGSLIVWTWVLWLLVNGWYNGAGKPNSTDIPGETLSMREDTMAYLQRSDDGDER